MKWVMVFKTFLLNVFSLSPMMMFIIFVCHQYEHCCVEYDVKNQLS